MLRALLMLPVRLPVRRVPASNGGDDDVVDAEVVDDDDKKDNK